MPQLDSFIFFYETLNIFFFFFFIYNLVLSFMLVTYLRTAEISYQIIAVQVLFLSTLALFYSKKLKKNVI